MKAFPTYTRPLMHFDGEKLTHVAGGIEDAGMDLRDYFAAHCPEFEIPKIVLDDVAEYLSKPSHMVFGEEMAEGFIKLRALARYKYADAMLDARKD